jgi:hypothetical protein
MRTQVACHPSAGRYLARVAVSGEESIDGK